MYKLITYCLLVVGGCYSYYSIDKLATDESRKIKIASKATYKLIDMVASDIPDCVQEYKISGNMQYDEIDYARVKDWTYSGLTLCSTQHLFSGINFIKASWELSYIPLKMTIPYELIKNIVENSPPEDCEQAIQELTYICPNYIMNHVIDIDKTNH